MAFGYGATFTRVFDARGATRWPRSCSTSRSRSCCSATWRPTALPDQIPWGYLLSYFLGVAAVFGTGMTLARLVFGGSFERQAIIGFGGGVRQLGAARHPSGADRLRRAGEPAAVPAPGLPQHAAVHRDHGDHRGRPRLRAGLRAVPLRAIKAGSPATRSSGAWLGGIGFGLAGLRAAGRDRPLGGADRRCRGAMRAVLGRREPACLPHRRRAAAGAR